jgi:hypothetical protein
MLKYRYSVIRFVPSPTRGEFVNLGVIVGSDATDEWAMELVGRKSRAAKLDDAGILPLVSTELQRLQLRFSGDDDESSWGDGPEINEVWLAEMASQSRNVVQYTPPQPILAVDVAAAMEKLWNTFIVDHVRQKRESLSRHQIRTLYLKSLQQFQLTPDQLKAKVKLSTGHSTTSIDVAVYNGVAKRLTQCWSFQVKDTESVLNEVKAWGWTMRDLRRSGGEIRTSTSRIQVPGEVELSVVYALMADTKPDEFTEEAIEVFNDADVHATAIQLEDLDAHARAAAELLQIS